jgi:hypothetical protein
VNARHNNARKAPAKATAMAATVNISDTLGHEPAFGSCESHVDAMYVTTYLITSNGRRIDPSGFA